MSNVVDIGKLKGNRLAEALRALDDRLNLQSVHRRLQAAAKVLIVTTFVEDSLRVLLTFSVQQQSMKIAGWETPVLHTLLPTMSFVVQCGGSLLVTMPRAESGIPAVGCYILLVWCVWHPFMYRQQTNWEFVLETTTIMGGLLVLLSHFQLSGIAADRTPLIPAKAEGGAAPTPAVARRAGRNQAAGRVMITAVFIFYAFQKVHGYARRLQQRTEEYDWMTPIGEAVVIVGGLYVCSLIIIGMKSRWCALLLALTMAVTDLYMHPFWLFMFSTKTYLMEGARRIRHRHAHTHTHTAPRGRGVARPALPPGHRRACSHSHARVGWAGVAGMEGYEVDAFTMADHQRYFFFQTMSTVGALLLLMVHGPGKLSMDEQNGPLQIITTKGDA